MAKLITADMLNNKSTNPFFEFMKSSDGNNKNNNNNNNNNNNKSTDITYKEKERKRQLVLVVDVREGRNLDLLDCIKADMERFGIDHRVSLKLKALDLFDFRYESADGCVFGPQIERKVSNSNHSDIAQSIKDGRYSEQKARMTQIDAPSCCKILLYEGDFLQKNYGIAPKSLMGAAIKPAARGENEVCITAGHRATARFLVETLRYLEHLDDAELVRTFTYVDGVKNSSRKRDFVEENKLALMIKGFVHGASAEVAKAVVAQYPTLADLQAAFVCGSEATKRTIAALTYRVPESGNIDKIGPACAQKIYEFSDVDNLVNKLPVLQNVAGILDFDEEDVEKEEKKKSPQSEKKKRKTSWKPPTPKTGDTGLARTLNDEDDIVDGDDD